MVNKLDCGCVLFIDGLGIPLVIFCPKHKSAPDLYEALKLAVDALTLKLDSPTAEDAIKFHTITEPAIIRAIAKAEGK